jgi:hypothetical protein
VEYVGQDLDRQIVDSKEPKVSQAPIELLKVEPEVILVVGCPNLCIGWHGHDLSPEVGLARPEETNESHATFRIEMILANLALSHRMHYPSVEDGLSVLLVRGEAMGIECRVMGIVEGVDIKVLKQGWHVHWGYEEAYEVVPDIQQMN